MSKPRNAASDDDRVVIVVCCRSKVIVRAGSRDAWTCGKCGARGAGHRVERLGDVLTETP